MPMKLFSFLILLTTFTCGYGQITTNEFLDSGEVPFKMVKNTILIPVTVNGETYQFVFDTGGFLSISEHIRQEEKLATVDSIQVSDVSKQVQSFDVVEIEEVALGALTFRNQRALAIYNNAHYPENCFGADGMIGRDFFKGMIVELDYQTGTLKMSSDPDQFNLDHNHRAKMRISERGIPDVLLTINGKSQYVEFDSGSGDFFSFKTKDAKRLRGLEKDEKLNFEGIFSYGVSSRTNIESTVRYRPKVESLQLGGTTFTNFYSHFSKRTEPRIGASILYYGKVIMDFQEEWFYYEPYETAPQIPAFETFGFDVAYLNEEYIIKWVLEGSPAAEQGLRYGWKVIAINGQTISSLTQDACTTYLNGYAFQQQDEVSLELLDSEGVKHQVRLTKLSFSE
jgi:hypothetical protein